MTSFGPRSPVISEDEGASIVAMNNCWTGLRETNGGEEITLPHELTSSHAVSHVLGFGARTGR